MTLKRVYESILSEAPFSPLPLWPRARVVSSSAREISFSVSKAECADRISGQRNLSHLIRQLDLHSLRRAGINEHYYPLPIRILESNVIHSLHFAGRLKPLCPPSYVSREMCKGPIPVSYTHLTLPTILRV